MNNPNVRKRDVIRVLSRICFVIYMVILVYFLLLSDGFGRGNQYMDFRYNLIPFREIIRFIRYRQYIDFGSVLVNLAGNVVAFMPFGALIRWVVNKRVFWYQAVLYTLLFSLSVELLQLVARVGVFDVDDLILNTLGGLFGFWIYYILLLINRRRERDAER
ncbi:MAG: VanZ family protein [Clostridium sp.]|nr:VanZ family protein [Clostridium sp.]